jgi:hypothetical protein
MPYWNAVFGFSLMIVFYSFSFTLQRALAGRRYVSAPHFLPLSNQLQSTDAITGESLLRSVPEVACDLTNTWQIDCHFVRFDAARCAFDELPIFIGKSLF